MHDSSELGSVVRGVQPQEGREVSEEDPDPEPRPNKKRKEHSQEPKVLRAVPDCS
jgi:hypothetical protein